MRWLFLALGLAVAALGMPSAARGDKPATGLDRLAWMAGAWVQRQAGAEVEEHWLPPKAGLMLGVNRTVRGDRTSFEFLRIARTATGISYFASPQGRPATEFPLVRLDDRKAVFENPKHDFPQRIIYWLSDDGTLRARIEGKFKGQDRAKEWRWEKVR